MNRWQQAREETRTFVVEDVIAVLALPRFGAARDLEERNHVCRSH
jgi:hypothetical protein